MKTYEEYQEWLKTPEGIAYLNSPEYKLKQLTFKEVFDEVFIEVLKDSGLLKVCKDVVNG